MLFNDGRVVSNFIVQALRGQDITIYGDGSQTRSFCFVSDLVAGIISAMNKDEFHGPVNLGNPQEMTIVELAELIIKMTGARSKLCYQKLPKDDPTRRKPDISLAERELNWKPLVDVSLGLQQTIDDFNKRLAQGER
jgi:UDP-glucuronate decarboxylase